MKNRILSFAVAALLAPLAAFSDPLEVDRPAYSLTYPEGWSDSLLPVTDPSLTMVVNVENQAASWAQLVPDGQGLDAAAYMAILSGLHAEGFSRTDSSAKQLGGRAFITTAWKDTTEEGDPEARLRFYAFSEGDVLFVSWVAYDTEDAEDVAGDIESALASLTLKTATALRRPLPGKVTSVRRPSLDALGRTAASSPLRAPATPRFPAR